MLSYQPNKAIAIALLNLKVNIQNFIEKVKVVIIQHCGQA
jgi:hypothetical protein